MNVLAKLTYAWGEFIADKLKEHTFSVSIQKNTNGASLSCKCIVNNGLFFDFLSLIFDANLSRICLILSVDIEQKERINVNGNLVDPVNFRYFKINNWIL